VLRSDGRLIGAVALAMFVLPGVIADLVTPPHPGEQMAPPGYWTLVSFVSLMIGIAGQLAVVRLALGPRITVGDAIRHGARRLFPYVGASLLWILPFALTASVLLSLSPDPQKPTAGVALGILILLGGFLFMLVRMILGVAVASAEPLGATGVLKRSWALGRGNSARLFAFLVLLGVAGMVLIVAVSTVIFTLVKLTLGDVEPFTVAALLTSLAAQLVGAVLTSVLMVMLARLYTQLSGGESSASGLPNVRGD
jgi:hypothetical protein